MNPQEHALREAQRVFFETLDPTVSMDGSPLPAATTLLHRVCDNDPAKFEEATRIVGLFIAAALESAAVRFPPPRGRK